MKSNKITITFVLPNLMAGGAERVFSFIAQNIDSNKFKTTLLVIGYSKDASFDIKNINVVYLEKSRVKNGIIALFNYIRKNKPDILVSAIGHLNLVVAYMSIFFPKTKFIAREVTVLSLDAAFFRTKNYNPFAFVGANRFNYFDKIICQSQDMIDDIKDSYKIAENKLVLINNPITDGFKLKKQSKKNNPIRYITVGRLSREKGIDRIIEILSKLDHPFHYTLIGNGVEKENLYALIEAYKLSNKITHIEFTKEVAKYLECSDYFLQGSHFEGFPNCLIESCSVGTPVIAFKAPGGTKEIVTDGVNGYLVATEAEFIEKLNKPNVWEPELVRASVLKKFNKEIILKQYEDLFTNLIKKQS